LRANSSYFPGGLKYLPKINVNFFVLLFNLGKKLKPPGK
jgi:hypothetical protein